MKETTPVLPEPVNKVIEWEVREVAYFDVLSLAGTAANENVYNYGKAKLFNIIEAILEGKRLEATKKLIEDVLTEMSSRVYTQITNVLLIEK